jgi:hypothetical protein
MSDNPTTTIEQAVDTLRERERELADECEIARGRVASLEARQDELRQAIGILTYARPKRGRPKGSANSAPAPTQPGGYDDSVSLDTARGILRDEPELPTMQNMQSQHAADGAAGT